MMSKHKHHIIPVYHCKELGIDPDFDENIVEVDRLDHARIHWGYKCDDLEPLFEYITPAQWIIDLIPRGDNRDVGAAVITAKGELDEIDMSGENNPMDGRGAERTGENNPHWKGGISSDIKAYMKEYQKEYEQTPQRKAYKKEYNKTYNQIPEHKAKKKAYDRARYLRKKLEKQQGQGTLEQHIG